MSTELRLCYTGDFPTLLKYHPHEERFTDLCGPHANEALSLIKFLASKMNRSIVLQYPLDDKQSGLGDMIDAESGKYDGCIGRLQDNSSDLLLILMDYPMDIKNISQGTLLTDSYVNIGSAYFFKDFEPVTIISMFKYLSTEIYFIIVAYLVLIWLFLVAHSYLKFKMKEFRKVPVTDKRFKVARAASLYKIILHFASVDAISADDCLGKMIFLVLSFMSLLVLNYLYSCIKTDLAIAKDPYIIDTYKKIIQNGAKPMFLKRGNFHLPFKYARSGTVEEELWSYVTAKYREDEYMGGGDFNYLVTYPPKILRQEVVLMADTLMSQIVVNSACELKAKDIQTVYNFFKQFVGTEMQVTEETIRHLGYITKVDPNTKKLPKGLLVSQNFSRSPDYKKFLSFASLGLQSGIMAFNIAKMLDINVINKHETIRNLFGPSIPEKRIIVEECKGNQPIRPDAVIFQISFSAFYSVFELCLYVCIVALIFYSYENRRFARFRSASPPN